MKTPFLLLTVLALGSLPTGAQPSPLDSAPTATIVARGPHHALWQRVTAFRSPTGKLLHQTNAYVELATGLHYQQDGRWVQSQETIELLPHGAIARQGPHQVLFAPNLNTAGAIDLRTPDGQRLRSHLLGLAYTDEASGRSVLIALVQDSPGEVLAPNQVLYRHAFTDYKVDVRYTYTRAGLEQDILLRERLDPPESYGLDSASTRLEVFTEFVEAPPPRRQRTVVRRETDPARRAALREPDLVDETLDFGVMQMGPGQAFPLGRAPADPFASDTLPTGKRWERREGRQFLLERVEYFQAAPQLEALPVAAVQRAERTAIWLAGAQAKEPASNVAARSPPSTFHPPATGLALLPPAPPPRLAEPPSPMQLASRPVEGPAFVLDYLLLSSATNFTFQGDTTIQLPPLRRHQQPQLHRRQRRGQPR